VVRRRPLLAGLLAGASLRRARAEVRRWRIGFANLDDTPGVTLEGLGFTGADVRRSFELAARTLPVDLLCFDNSRDPARALANVEAAIGAKVDLLIEYSADAGVNTEIARRLTAAGIPALALVYPLPGFPLYGPDNRVAGQIAGHALGTFAQETWAGERVLGVLIGDLADAGPAVADRVEVIASVVR
jgi:ABC-type sugar transport system substrate-binding protein